MRKPGPRAPLAARIAAALALGVAVYYAVWGGEYSALDMRHISTRIRAEEEQVGEARARVDSLRAVATALESDPATIEAVARERFGLIRDGEILYRFVPPDSPSPEPRRVAGRP